MESTNRYFNEALSDFVHDVASGGAIRHLVNLGYSLDQIMANLTYPEKRDRVQKAMMRYMTESGIISYEEVELPEKSICVKGMSLSAIMELLCKKEEFNGEGNSLVTCPFGMIDNNGFYSCKKPDHTSENKTASVANKDICASSNGLKDVTDSGSLSLSFLSKRERDYIQGIKWERRLACHRLTRRMREISAKLLFNGFADCKVIFLREGVVITPPSSS